MEDTMNQNTEDFDKVDNIDVPKPEPLTPEQVRKEREDLLASVRTRIAELRKERDEAAKEMLDMQAEETKLIDSLDPTKGTSPDRSNILNIREYLKSQNELRMKRAAARAEALKRLDGDVSALRGKAPIDMAHARNTSRGTSRPQYAPKV